MIKLNDNNIFVGQIKQLLHNFNLPTFNIGEENKQIDKHYLKGNSIYLYKKDIDTEQNIYCDEYTFNKKYENLTTNLNIINNVYDRTTHRYLGKYLRFLRDYNRINLMSMYNIFDTETIEKKIKIDGVLTFDVNTTNYISYKMPVELFEYTISLSSQTPIEFCISFENIPESYSSILADFQNNSYRKLKINNKYKLDIKNLIQGTIQQSTNHTKFYNYYKQNMRLILKVPTYYRGPIVVLEGDFTKDYHNPKGFVYYPEESTKLHFSGFYTIPQLFSYQNNNVNNMLADRLVEFLTSNVISNISESYDIKKVQNFLKKHDYLISDYWGIWGNKEDVSIKKFISEHNLCSKFDTTGYVDSDVEREINNYCNNNNEEGII